ncbi:MAG: superoxide dismutase [Cyanobacteria bacterium J06641_5]
MKRRDLLLTGGAAIAALSLGTRARADGHSGEATFTQQALPYAYNTLEPVISEETMRFHYDKHHAGYTKNLNKAVDIHPQLKQFSADTIIGNLGEVPFDVRRTVRNNGGGYVNHSIFWSIMTSPEQGGQPSAALASAISRDFGGLDNLKEQFNSAGAKQFGSGWAWLALEPINKTLVVLGFPNQDSPYMQGLYPVMGNDVWEHAYYLTYRNRRKEYLTEWWKVVNWAEVSRRYDLALAWTPQTI